MKPLVLFLALSVSAPLFAGQNFTVVNNTGKHGTARTTFSPCSSAGGDDGLIKPHTTFPIPNDVLSTFCSKKCTVEIFMNKNCGGRSIASIKIDRRQGILNISPHNRDYKITGSGFTLVVDQ